MIIIIGGEILFIGRPSILQNLWDIDFKDSKVMIILCGSAMSFIEKELLAEKNPLCGRATGIYKMKEIFAPSMGAV